MIKLICAIVGARGSAFSVKVDDDDLVDDLKDAIKVKNANTITCDAKDLQLFLAKKDEGRGAWLTEAEVKQGSEDTSGLTKLEYAGMPLSVVGFTKKAVRIRVTNEDYAAGMNPVHVLVKLPEPIVYAAASLTANVQLPTASALNEPETFDEECNSLNDWGVNAVHKIPSIWRFMSSLGGCTQKGEIFWRMEDKQIVSLLMDGWFRESSPLAKKRSIMVGSPGIGKSTLLCMMAFHLVFKHKKNVLVYRQLRKEVLENCLIYLGYEDGKVVQFAVKGCEDHNAINIYKELIRQQGISNVWLLLDGFRYQDIPNGVHTFKMLATSQQVDLKSGERVDAYCCLLPCWSRTDLFSMGKLIHEFRRRDMGDRFYYSGGSVREFTMTGCKDIIEAIDSATSCVDDASNLLSNKSSILTGGLQVDRLRHTFIKNRDDLDPLYSAETWDPFIYRSCWEHIIDSEYAARCLSLRLRSDALSKIYTWAKNTGNNSLTGGVFEILLHRLAADNQLDLYISEYDLPEKNKPKAPRHLEVKQAHLEKHSAICSGTATDYVANLTKWRDDETYSYWFPACRLFRNIDSIVKLKSTSGKKGNVAYLQFTVAARHAIDSEQLKKMNEIFFPDHVKSAGDTEPPIYIAVCPDLKSCKALVLKPANKVSAAKEICRVFVGYYTENKFGIAADGPRNDVLLKTLPPKSSHHLRKRSRLE